MALRLNIIANLKKRIGSSFQPLQIAEEILKSCCIDNRVASGPFKGLLYESESVGSVFLPKLLGIYEQELHSQITKCIEQQPRLVVDIGAAEGYYAVGIAKMCPNTKVIAFEAEEKGRKLIQQMAGRNLVQDQIKVDGFCSALKLREVLLKAKPELVIVDIEGGEGDVLSLENVPLLNRSTLIVETHPWVVSDINLVLTDRFNDTHAISTIMSQTRSVWDLPIPCFKKIIFGRWLRHLISERRPIQMTWLIMTPKFGWDNV